MLFIMFVGNTPQPSLLQQALLLFGIETYHIRFPITTTRAGLLLNGPLTLDQYLLCLEFHAKELTMLLEKLLKDNYIVILEAENIINHLHAILPKPDMVFSPIV